MLLVFMFGKICQQFLWFLFLVAVDMCKTYVGCDLQWNKKPNKWWTMFKLMEKKNCNTIFDQSCAFNSYRLVITKFSTTCVPETMIVWNLRLTIWSYDVCWLDFVFFFFSKANFDMKIHWPIYDYSISVHAITSKVNCQRSWIVDWLEVMRVHWRYMIHFYLKNDTKLTVVICYDYNYCY